MVTSDKDLKNLVLGCEHCGQNFEITEGELDLYKKVDIELPILFFYCKLVDIFLPKSSKIGERSGFN